MPLPPTALQLYPSAPGPYPTGQQEPRPASWPRGNRQIPNLSDWQPGDVLVFELHPGRQAAPHPVAAFQARHADPAVVRHATCTPCAVYLGAGLMADARLGRLVGVRRLSGEVGVRRTGVYRFKPTVVTAALIGRFLDVVYELEDVPYAQLGRPFLAWAGGGNQHLSAPPQVGGLVCSALLEYAAHHVGIGLGMVAAAPLMPASLVGHPFLDPVPAAWRLAV